MASQRAGRGRFGGGGGGFGGGGGGFGGGGFGGGLGGGGLGFGGRLTRTGRLLLTVYGSIFLVELVLYYWMGIDVVSLLALPELPLAVTRPWTFVTHHFVQPPGSPLAVLFMGLAIYFFAGPLEEAMGRRRFVRWWIAVAAGAMVFGQVLSVLPIGPLHELFARAPFMGIAPGVLAMVATFGLLHPNAQILLFFILPIRAIWITYITVGAVIVAILTRSGAEPFYHLGGLAAGYAVFRGGLGRLSPNLLWLRWKQWRLQRKLARFRVIEGGRREDHRGPTIH
ncbi:rhomboid family intramembrane serine protease [Myxococcota bacterium]|nr:rhomboid family intramembrane serine protease [Myxococcota bacterium]